jgi:acetyl esterase/lipase
MKHDKISLKDVYDLEGGELECMVAESPFDVPAPDWKRPAVIVVPGGGYWMTSKREGEPVAHYFLAKGFQTFILEYKCRVDEARYPEQLFERAAAVDYVKKHAEEYHVNPEEVFAVGFSAGGHLVADLSVEYPSVPEKYGRSLDCTLRAVGLGYPVISAEYGHVESYGNLLEGYTEEAKAELMKTLNLDKAVTEKTLPAFIWTTSEDACVPPINSLAFATALSRNKIPFELHVYPNGVHGGSACNYEINPVADYFKKNEQWLENCASFFRLFTVEKF